MWTDLNTLYILTKSDRPEKSWCVFDDGGVQDAANANDNSQHAYPHARGVAANDRGVEADEVC